MPLPNIEDWTPMLDRLCADVVGETISYSLDGSVFEPVKAHVDYKDAIKAMEMAQAIEQDIAIAFLKVDVMAKPTGKARIRLSKAPGRLFRPINVRSDAAGTEWNFEVEDVPNA